MPEAVSLITMTCYIIVLSNCNQGVNGTQKVQFMTMKSDFYSEGHFITSPQCSSHVPQGIVTDFPFFYLRTTLCPFPTLYEFCQMYCPIPPILLHLAAVDADFMPIVAFYATVFASLLS